MSPRVGSEPFQEVVAGAAIKEEDEEDPETHFKRKRKESSSVDPPIKNRMVSKPARRVREALQIEEEKGESVAYVPSPPFPIIGSPVHEEVRVPPPTSQVVGLLVREESRKEPAPVTGNIIIFCCA